MQRKRPLALTLALTALAAGLLAFAVGNSGNFLVVDNRQKSDVLVITQGDSLDAQYWMGLDLLAQGYGRDLLLDGRTNLIFFGRSQADWAAEFIGKTAGAAAGNVKLCPVAADTTAEEVYEVAGCLKGARSVLLIVADFHSRRSLAIFSRLLPGYRWSVAPVTDAARFGRHWWRKREWIRTAAVEWQHLLWWEVVDRWRFAPLPNGPRPGDNPDVSRVMPDDPTQGAGLPKYLHKRN